MKMINNPMLFFFLLVTVSCCSFDSKKRIVEDFYQNAQQYESKLSTLLNVTYVARGTKNGRPLISRIEIALNEDEVITLPGISKEMTDEEIKNSPFYYNMKVYSDKLGLLDSSSYQKVKEYSANIVELAHKLEAYKIQSTPWLGKFIIFSLSEEDQVVYLFDKTTVKNDYWKNFFESGKKIGENWYYRKSK